MENKLSEGCEHQGLVPVSLKNSQTPELYKGNSKVH